MPAMKVEVNLRVKVKATLCPMSGVALMVLQPCRRIVGLVTPGIFTADCKLMPA